MTSNTALEKAVQLLEDQTPRILDLEQQVEPSEHDAALLRAFGRVAFAVARQKGIATAGSDKPSEIIRKLVPLTPLQPRITEEAARKSRRESNEKAVLDLKALAKSNASDPKIYDDLATILLNICRARGVAVSASASPAELLDRVRPLLLIEGMKLKTPLP